ALAAVSVVPSNGSPTGYKVTIKYHNSSAQEVQIAGIPHFTNQYQTTITSAASFDPTDYKPGDFPAFTDVSVYSMEAKGDGAFTFTRPLPSGTYQYYFLPDCQNVTLCVSMDQGITDPDNPPFETVQGTEAGSPFQVPYHPGYQSYADVNLNFDYALPVSGPQGKIVADFYPSPGAVSPSADLHDFAVYLPPGYDNNSAHAAYPLLYLSHGGGGAAGDWQNQGQVSNILDRLILEGHIEPTVVVMPTFNGLLNTSNPSAQIVRPLYQQYLFPYIESHYHVSTDPGRRAFAGLSLGSALTYEMYINATSYFGYYGLFSGALAPGHPLDDYVNTSMAAQNPALLDRGLTVAYGLFDIAFDDTRLLQEALDGIGSKYVSRVAPFGFHAWNTWQDALWTFGRTTLWKARPL
ncbi:carbohydrate esterase family 1 protein, partial [Pseudocercospora fijiensis CIRAD86]